MGAGGRERVYMNEELPSREVGWKRLLALDGMGGEKWRLVCITMWVHTILQHCIQQYAARLGYRYTSLRYTVYTVA